MVAWLRNDKYQQFCMVLTKKKLLGETMNEGYRCGVALTLDVIGGKWKGVILWHLLHKTLRFSQLQRRIVDVTQKMLTQQLRELERDGLVHRQVYAEVPPRVEYSLTSKGESLRELLTIMCAWGGEHVPVPDEDARGGLRRALVKDLGGQPPDSPESTGSSAAR